MKRTLVLAIFSIALALPLFAQEMSSQQKEVWQMEETYWRDVKGFDEAHYYDALARRVSRLTARPEDANRQGGAPPGSASQLSTEGNTRLRIPLQLG